MTENPTIFADAMLDASLLHGVLRVRLGQVAGGGNALVPAGQLVMPLNEVPGLLTALRNVLEEAEARLRAATTQMVASASIAGGGATTPVKRGRGERTPSYSATAVSRGRSVSHPPPSAL